MVDYAALIAEHGEDAWRHSGMKRREFRAATKNLPRLKKLTPVSAPPGWDQQRLGYEDRIRSLEKALRDAQRGNLDSEKVSQFYFDLKQRPLEIPQWLWTDAIPASKKSLGNAGVPVTNWSDWHYGEVVERKQVEGANEFNISIFDRRYKTLVERTIDLCRGHMTGQQYPGIVVNLGGDMLSGNIHEELHQTNELETIPAVLDLAGKIAGGLGAFADEFGRVFVPCVPGNHGRNTKKPQAKNAAHTSFDWMIYKILEMHFKDDKRIQFFIPEGFDAYYRVFSHRILLTHGDRLGSKGGDGFIGAIGPILRGAHKLRLSYAARGREIDTLICGHWHNEIALPGLRVNNCLKGYDEWAMSMRFTPTPPSQDLFFIHAKRGVTCSWPIQLESKGHGQDEKLPWLSWKEAGE